MYRNVSIDQINHEWMNLTNKFICDFWEQVFWKHAANLQENILLKHFIKKETLAQVFSCEFSEISENTFSYRTPPVAASTCMFWMNFTISNNSHLSSNIRDNIILDQADGGKYLLF